VCFGGASIVTTHPAPHFMRNILEFSIEQGVGAPESEPHNGLRLGKPGKRGRCVAELGVE